eukprot:10853570-Ditylum_brightwellii.AAC.2
MKEELIKWRANLDQAVEDGSNVIWYPFGGTSSVGQGDKASDPVAKDVPIADVSGTSSNALVPTGCSIEAKDHDWYIEKNISSVTHYINIGNHTLESM